MIEQIKNRLESILNNLDQLPSIPEVASKVINMINDPDVSFQKISDEIIKDQNMTTNILKLSNSAYFSKGKEISSIERAMVTLGLKEVKNIVMVVATKPVLDKQLVGYDLMKGDLWKQGLLVANLSSHISIAKKRKDISDVVFTGGLIHNVGKIIIAYFLQKIYKQVLETVQTKNIPFHLAERTLMGFDHQEVGKKILEKWNFPEVLQSIVRYYHEPGFAPSEYKFEVSVVHIANALCNMAGIGVGSDGLYQEVRQEAIDTLGLSDSEINEFFSKIPNYLKQMQELI